TVEEYRTRFPGVDPCWLAQQIAPSISAGTAPQSSPASDNTDQSTARRELKIRCPQCHNPIVLADAQREDVLCPGCGSSFQVRDTQPTCTLSPMKQLGKFQLLERVGLGAFGP